MQIVGEQKLWSFTPRGKLQVRTCFDVRKDAACEVADFMDLATKVAALQFNNPDYVLLFRGQDSDYKRENLKHTSFSSLVPTLLRGEGGATPDAAGLERLFRKLKRAEVKLVRAFNLKGWDDLERLKRQQILRWAILQHYEVCPTPLLDVTQSLRVAASFASRSSPEEAFVYVLGVPNLSGAITASAEGGIQIVRLASVCPPVAVRPHIQEGYLLGEYPELSSYDQKEHYSHYEIDFGRRVIAKFRFDPTSFWERSGSFPPIVTTALYPNRHDPLYAVAKSIKEGL